MSKAVFLALVLILAGCANPTKAAVDVEATRKVSPGKSSVIGGGKVIAAGGGNLVAAGGGNLVAAGGGNLVAAGGGNLVGMDGGSFSSGGLPSAVNSSDFDQPASPSREMPGIGISPPGADDSLGVTETALRGTVKLPAAIATPTRRDQLPVGGARIAVFPYGRTTPLVEDFANAQGAFSLSKPLSPGLYVVRAAVKLGPTTYRLAALAVVAGDAVVDLDAGSTLLAARFATAVGNQAPEVANGLDPASWNADAAAFGGQVAPSALVAGAADAEQAAAWAKLAKDNPTMQADDKLETWLIALTTQADATSP